MDYINLLHASGMYEKQTAKIIPFRSIDIFENAVSAGTGNFLVDGPKETVRIDESILPEDTTFGVRISGDSMDLNSMMVRLHGYYNRNLLLMEKSASSLLTEKPILRNYKTIKTEFSLSLLMKSMHLSRLVKMTA